MFLLLPFPGIIPRTVVSLMLSKGLPDNALMCRGGTCTAYCGTAERFAQGSGVTIDAASNKKVGVSTVGNVRSAGGDVVPRPTSDNPFHCELYGITPEQAEQLFTPTVQNPNIP